MKTFQPSPFRRTRRSLLFTSLLLVACVASRAQSPVFSNLWTLAAGGYDLPTAANNNRGIAINPITTNVLYASTAGGSNHVSVLDGTNNGTYLGALSGSDVTGGTLALAPVRVADDGSIYGCNVALFSATPGAGSTFKIYRWASETDFTTPPTVIFSNNPSITRYGDYMDVRGSGINTEILVGGNGTNFIILKPQDGTLTTWTNVVFNFPNNLAIGGQGIAFEGTNNAFYGKRPTVQTVYRVVYDPTIPTNYISATFNLDQSQTAGLDYAEVNGVKLLSAVCYSTTAITNGIQHRAKVFQLTTPSNAVIVLNADLPQPNYANPNGAAMTDIKNSRIIFGESGNGFSFYSLNFVTNVGPSIGSSPVGATTVESYNFTFNISPSGTAPLSYQWYFNTNSPIPGATTNSLTVTNLNVTNSGTYSVIVTNLYGSATSGLATLTVLPAGFSQVMTQIWSLAPGSRDYLTTTDTQRGLAADSKSERVILVSRAPTNGVHLLDAATGADLGDMDVSILSAGTPPGTFAINMAGVAEDGVVYVCNLLTTAGSDFFAIYRWDSASNGVAQGVAYLGNPAVGRLGDTFAARGAGVGTELLAAFRTGTSVALFNTGDGFNFAINVLTITNLPPDAVANGFAGLGLAFGPTNTFWAKSSGFKLRLVQYDLVALTGTVLATYDALPNAEYPIGVDNANGILASIGAGVIPQNLAVYNLESGGEPILIDRELFPASNANGNGTGAVPFDIAGGRAFALDSNSGVIAMKYAGRLRQQQIGNRQVLSWAVTAAKLQSSTNVAGPYSDVAGATSPYTNSTGTLFFRLRR